MKWGWTIAGTQSASGTMVREQIEKGKLDAECAGEVLEWLVDHGPWDMIDQRDTVSILIVRED